MTAPSNPLTYNGYIETMGSMAVVNIVTTGGINSFADAPLQAVTSQMLNYAELRIQRDMNLLSSVTTNTYTLTAGTSVFNLPVDDFVTVQTLEVLQTNGAQVVNATPLLPTSAEFIQNCYSGLVVAQQPQYFAMIGDNFGDDEDSFTNILLGPTPNYPYSIRVKGTSRSPSLFSFSDTQVDATTMYTYISSYFPDLLVIASMIYVSMYQRNFSSTSDSPDMGATYEKQYQALRLGAIGEEDRRKQMGSAWSAYATPASATPTR
jgi:hypothetical protein